MTEKTIVPYSIDDLFASAGVGSLDKAIGNNLYGINHRQTPTSVPSNKDTYGLTFFVRPQLNLQVDNLRNSRILYPLLTNKTESIQQVIRCALDPRLMAGYKHGRMNVPPISCQLLDNRNAFFPFLTNNLNSISGWPDNTLPTWSSKPGLFKEVFSMPDGLTKNHGTFTLDASFRNVIGDPTLVLFHVWEHYMSLVKKGDLIPYPDYLTTNTMDWCSRIYRFTLDQQKQTVTKAFATGFCYPISNPTGSFADFNKETPYNDQNKDITIRFQCHVFEALDDILIDEFNKTVCIFNPMMRDEFRKPDKGMIKLNKLELTYFNNRGYPRIDYRTYELEWWVPTSLYQSRATNLIPRDPDFTFEPKTTA